MTDEYLLAALRMAAGVDPAPHRATTDANAAFALRLPGAVLAEPFAVTETAGAGIRADGTPTMHRFTAEGITIDLEAAVEGGRLQVAGQVSPAPEPGAGGRRSPSRDYPSRDYPSRDSKIAASCAQRSRIEGSWGDGSWGDGSWVEVRTPDVSEIRSLSREGRFAVSDLPPGWMSLVWHRSGEAPVATRWLRIRE